LQVFIVVANVTDQDMSMTPMRTLNRLIYKNTIPQLHVRDRRLATTTRSEGNRDFLRSHRRLCHTLAAGFARHRDTASTPQCPR